MEATYKRNNEYKYGLHNKVEYAVENWSCQVVTSGLNAQNLARHIPK
jgi:hypothetical protein